MCKPTQAGGTWQRRCPSFSSAPGQCGDVAEAHEAAEIVGGGVLGHAVEVRLRPAVAGGHPLRGRKHFLSVASPPLNSGTWPGSVLDTAW